MTQSLQPIARLLPIGSADFQVRVSGRDFLSGPNWHPQHEERRKEHGMTALQLGRLERHDLRDIWTNEAKDSRHGWRDPENLAIRAGPVIRLRDDVELRRIASPPE